MDDQKSDAFAELYNFLLGCFTRADTDLDGKVFIDQFDSLIEEAADLPRKYGLAPKSSDMYSTDDVRKAARAQMFREMNLAKDGYITFEEWIGFSIKHIMGKVATLDRDYLAGDCTKQEFIGFIRKAVIKTNPEYRDLYFFLLKCFADADRDRDGAVNSTEFDAMIEVAAAAPRKHGLAPLSRVMFKNDAQRLAKRTEYFRQMDKNRDNTISFDEWLQYANEHIMGKVAALK
jgi:Ca2+-binding EF-hand superfamily protein